jgi:hypothetical protein
MDTPNYIRSLLIPNGNKPRGRRVWSIDLESVWLPFLTATNTVGDTAIPVDALGAPLRLAYNADGSVKFSKAGRPVTKVAKEVGDSVKLIRENFTAGLVAYAGSVIADNPDGYKAQIELAREAGEPITAKDRANLDKAIANAMVEAVAEAEVKAKAKIRGNKAKVAVTA